MSDAELETAAPANEATPQAPSTPAAAPASTPAIDYDKLIKKAKAEGYREGQAVGDRRIAREMKASQAAQTARQRLEQSGVRDSAVLDDYTVTVQKARRFDEAEAEAEQYQAGVARAQEIAETFGVEPGDLRIQGTDSWAEYTAKVKTAAADDLKAKHARALATIEAAKTAQVDAQIASGALDTLGGSGGAAALSQKQKVEQAKSDLKSLLAKPGKKDLSTLENLKATIRAG